MKSKTASQKHVSKNLSNEEKFHHNNKFSEQLQAPDKLNAPIAPLNGNKPKATCLDRVKPQSSQLDPAKHLTNSHLRKMGTDVMGNLTFMIMSSIMFGSEKEFLDAAELDAENFLKNMHPTDALEEVAIKQVLIAHARLSWLTSLLATQKDPESVRTLSEACDRATGSFARLYRVISENRRLLSRPGTTVSIGHANLAHQQVVQNFPKEEVKIKHGDPTRGNEPGPTAKALPPHTEGPKIITKDDSQNAAVGKKHGAANTRRKSQKRNE